VQHLLGNSASPAIMSFQRDGTVQADIALTLDAALCQTPHIFKRNSIAKAV